METPELHILTRTPWALFGTLTFLREVIPTGQRLKMWFAFVRQAARAGAVAFPEVLWCLRMESGEQFGRRHFHFLIAGLPTHTGFRFMVMHKWESIGGGMARIRRFDPTLNGVGYVVKCLTDESKWDTDRANEYELAKFARMSCELTLSKSLLRYGVRLGHSDRSSRVHRSERIQAHTREFRSHLLAHI